MDEIRIAHISDLHFGAWGQTTTWELLKDRLQNQVHPHLILVTGDIANTPRKKFFRTARSELDNLCQGIAARYLVCAGNHDRFFYGNRTLRPVRALAKPFQWVAQVIRGSHLSPFDAHFGDAVPSLTAPANLTLGASPNEWRLRIFALDSNREADSFARGKVSWPDVQRLANAMEHSDEVDLGILLVHHHLLSVRGLEQSRQGTRALFNLTTLVNSGSLLEALACAHVDIALHGHEHRANWGRYATLSGGGGETAVIAAGSSTGAITLHKSDPSTASYNLIELRPDRSVDLTVYSWSGGAWNAGTHYQLLDSPAVRRNRLLRRSGGSLARPSTSEVVKHVEFTRARDGIVNESSSDWSLEGGKWSRLVWNETGVPTNFSVRFASRKGQIWTPNVPLVFTELPAKNPKDPRGYFFECDVDPAIATVPLHIEVSYTWLGGAVLTREELDALDATKRGPFRDSGYELAAATATSFLKSLTLAVGIPPELAPGENDIRVFQQLSTGDPYKYSSPPELYDYLRIIAPGNYLLAVPYPQKNMRYVVAWKPPLQQPAEEAEKFRTNARSKGAELVRRFYEGLTATPLGASAVVSLYVPSLGQVGRLDLVGSHPKEASPRPAQIEIDRQSMVVTLAWRGALAATPILQPAQRAENADALGMLQEERALIAVPVRLGMDWTNSPPWGVVRIGIRDVSPENTKLLDNASPEKATLRTMLLRPIIKMLGESGLGD